MYATATGSNQLVAIDEDSGGVVFRAPTDTYPDGLTSTPSGTPVDDQSVSGTETVIDANAGTVRATIALGGEVGNVLYNSIFRPDGRRRARPCRSLRHGRTRPFYCQQNTFPRPAATTRTVRLLDGTDQVILSRLRSPSCRHS